MAEESFYLLEHKNPHLDQYGEERRYDQTPSGTIVIHTAENVADQLGGDLGAENVAAYVVRRTNHGSYHRLVDADSIIKMAPFGYETWHCRNTNPWSIGISMAVMADDWDKYSDDYVMRVLRNAARAAAEAVRDLKKYWKVTVPLEHITGSQALAKRPGFTGHGETDPTRRHDPGSGFPWARFLNLVREELGDDPIEAEPVNNPITPAKPKPAPKPKGTEYRMNRLDLRTAHRTKIYNDDMKKWQGLLLAHGYGPRGLVETTGRPDGIGGAYTRRATLAFQKKAGIEEDAVVGPITWKKALEG
jgi:peptidoglycan hydrolase-like protein with peptidoglycan-binding domain